MLTLMVAAGEVVEVPTLSLSYASAVRAVVRTKGGDVNYLREYSALIRAPDDAQLGNVVNRLAHAATSESVVGLIARQIEDAIHVDVTKREVVGAAIGVGSFAERETLIRRLADAAVRHGQSDPNLAQKCARAALVLAADEGLVAANAVPLLWVLKRTEVIVLAQLDDDAADQLKAVCESYRAPRRSVESVIAAAKLLDLEIARLRNTDGAAPAGNWPELCASIARAFTESQRHPGCELDAAQLTWRSACLARAAQDQAGLALLADSVSKCKASASTFGARLIDEALTKPGPRPEYSGFLFFETPDDWKPKR
jgi:hypothetical protein